MNIWSRMKQWVKNGARSSDAAAGWSGAAGQLASYRADDTGGPDASRSAPGGVLSRRQRRDPVVEHLQDGYDQVIDLIHSIQEHQHAQESRAVEISSSLSRMAETLSCIENAGRDQASTLVRIADELRAGNERSGRWEEVISEFPRAAEAQRTALATVAQQMEAVGHRDNQMAESLNSFREAVTSLGDATTASSVAVKNLQMSTLEGDERTAALMKEQNKRFLMLFVVTLVLVAVAICSSAIALWNQSGAGAAGAP